MRVIEASQAVDLAGERPTSDRDRAVVRIVAGAVALLPLLQPAGPGNLAPVDLAMAVAVMAVLLWAGYTGWPLRAPYAASVGVFMVAGCLGALAGPVPLAGLLAVGQDLWLLAWALAVANVARTPASIRLILSTWCWAAWVWATVLLAGDFTGNAFLAGLASNEGSRTAGTFGDPNYAANYFVVSIMIMWATGTPRRRVVRLCAYSTLLVAWALTGSNSGIVGLVVATTTGLLIAVRRRFGVVEMVAVFCLLVLGATVVLPHVHLQRIQERAQASKYAVIRDGIGRSPSSVADRTLLLQESVALYFEGGLLGEGPVSTKTRLVQTQAPYVKEAHDDYFASIVERGILGALGLLLLLGSIFIRTWTVAIRPLSRAFGDVVPHPGAIAGAVAATLVSSTVYELLHVRHVWTLFAIVGALYLWGRKHPSPARTADLELT